MKYFCKELECFFDKNSNGKFKLGNQIIDFFGFEKKNCELIEYVICFLLSEALIDINKKYQKYLSEIEECFENDKSIIYLTTILLKEIQDNEIYITNIAIHLTIQKPRLNRTDLCINYKSNIKEYLQNIFQLQDNQIVVQAGTGEKIGRTGNSESIIVICNIGIDKIKFQNKQKIGFGYDRHRFEIDNTKPKKILTICGQKIDYLKCIDAHSDGDVILHGLVNAIFCTINMGDIGEHFSDLDQQWKNADSSQFVKYAMDKLKENKYKIIKLEIYLIVSNILYNIIQSNYSNFSISSKLLLEQICQTKPDMVDISIHSADHRLKNRDEKCIENDEGLEARIKIIVEEIIHNMKIVKNI